MAWTFRRNQNQVLTGGKGQSKGLSRSRRTYVYEVDQIQRSWRNRVSASDLGVIRVLFLGMTDSQSALHLIGWLETSQPCMYAKIREDVGKPMVGTTTRNGSATPTYFLLFLVSTKFKAICISLITHSRKFYSLSVVFSLTPYNLDSLDCLETGLKSLQGWVLFGLESYRRLWLYSFYWPSHSKPFSPAMIPTVVELSKTLDAGSIHQMKKETDILFNSGNQMDAL